MKRLILLLLIIMSVEMSSQKLINTLTTPNSPASSILGMQPSVVMKPKSFRALEAALYSNFSNEEGGITNPDDFGLEFTPYWAKDHGLSLEEYLFPKDAFKQIVRNSSFSLASTQNFLLQDETATKAIAIGYRTSLFFGNNEDKKIIKESSDLLIVNQQIGAKIMVDLESLDSETHKTKDDYLNAIRTNLTNRIHSVLKTKTKKEAVEMVNRIYIEAEDIAFKIDEKDSFFISFSELVEKEIKTEYTDRALAYEEFKGYIKARQGTSIDFAYAIFLSFPDNNFSFSEVPRYSVWLTPSYSFSKKLEFLKVNASLRYERYYKEYFEKYFPDSKVYDNNLDYGLSVTGNFKKFTVDFEATGRKSSSLIASGTDSNGNTLYLKDNSNDFQYIGTFSYRLTEQIALSYQIGSAFKPIFTTNGSLISLLSLNFGFGGPTRNDVSLK
ncbi:hypothetical protein [Flavobacterium sp. UBA7682]|uniref:hypothetical protein n=1 Tax=Flavobacterium sp. UBA7682 TaxID=1946560 RepID=UPI0025C58E40|nr:hypothetical protein [Flavobacterium sp. UBA7682]